MGLPKYLQIVEDIRQGIASGRYPKGHRLPTHEEMAEEWGTVPAVVTKGVRALKIEGLVYTTHAGTFIGPRPGWEEEVQRLREENDGLFRCSAPQCANTLEDAVRGTRRRVSLRELFLLVGWTYREAPEGRSYFCHLCTPVITTEEMD